MKTDQRTVTTTRLQRVEADLSECIEALFNRFPELIGFSVEDASVISGKAEGGRSDAASRLLIQIELVRTISNAANSEISDAISTDIGYFVCSQPDAFELLRGRTFARCLH